MSRPEDAGTELDALLATPTPEPGREDRRGESSTRPARSRLEAWLRGSDEGRGGSRRAPGLEPQADAELAATDAAGVVDGVVPVDGAPERTAGADGRYGVAAVDRAADARAEDGSVPGPDADADGGALRSLPIGAIVANAVQPRRHFDHESLTSLAASISTLGVLQPVLVRPIDGERYELVAGERRWRAAQLAGLRMIPALVRMIDGQGALEQAIVENLHRRDLNPLEEAAAYQQLVDDFGLTQEAVAGRVGKSRSAVANSVRLLQLPGAVQRLVIGGQLSAGHARALLAIDDPVAQKRLAERIIGRDLSVRQTEQAVRELAEGGTSGEPSSGSRAEKSVGALEVQLVLEERLETRVEVQESGRGGRLVIRFADQDDLDRLVGLISTDSTDLAD